MGLDRQRFFDDAYAHAMSMTKFSVTGQGTSYGACQYRVPTRKLGTPNASCLIGGFLDNMDAEFVRASEGQRASIVVKRVALECGVEISDVLDQGDLRFMNSVQECHDRPGLSWTVIVSFKPDSAGELTYDNDRHYEGKHSEMIDNLKRLAAHYGLTVPE